MFCNEELETIHSSTWRIYARAHKLHDKFAVAGSVLLPGTLNPSNVGNVPHEISRYIWYDMHHGAKLTGKVRFDKRKQSPLANGGLEIIIDIEVDWEDKEKLAILTKQVEQLNYPLYSDYCDDLNIIKDLGLNNKSEDDYDDVGI